MDGLQAINELNAMSKSLSNEIDKLEQEGIKTARAESIYKMTLRTEALKLKADNMAVTLIDKVVYGIDEVAQARLKRDIAEVRYKVAQERINGLKLQMRLLESQIEREWGRE